MGIQSFDPPYSRRRILCWCSDWWRTRRNEWLTWRPPLSRKTIAQGRCSKKKKKKYCE